MGKKIVIIARVIYPYKSPRSMRATELAIELALQGNDVTIYTKKGKFDYTTFEEENNLKVKSLGKTFFAKINSDSSAKYNLLDKVLRRLLGKWLEFPDVELVSNTYTVLKKVSDVDLLITIGRPFPLHWGAALYKSLNLKKIKYKWIADCGDPYMGNPIVKHPFYFKYIEKFFCKNADFITIPIEEATTAYYPEFRNKIKVIPQGFRFDEIDYTINYAKNAIPTFIYAGVFYKDIRDPRPLLDLLVDLKVDFRFYVYTQDTSLLIEYLEKLKGKLIVNNYIDRKQLLVEMSKADFLLNLENNTQLQSPSKLIDYKLVGRPVLSINSNNFNEDKVLNFLDGDYEDALVLPNIEDYDIKNISKKFLLLDS